MQFDRAEETDKVSLISFLPPMDLDVVDLDVCQPVSITTTILPGTINSLLTPALLLLRPALKGAFAIASPSMALICFI